MLKRALNRSGTLARKPFGTKRRPPRIEKTFYVPPKVKSLEKLLEDWAILIKLRDGGVCRMCKSSRLEVQAHHVFLRRHKATCLDVRNGLTLCAICHDFVQTNPGEARKIQRVMVGPKVYDELDRIHLVETKATIDWRIQKGEALAAFKKELA